MLYHNKHARTLLHCLSMCLVATSPIALDISAAVATQKIIRLGAEWCQQALSALRLIAGSYSCDLHTASVHSSHRNHSFQSAPRALLTCVCLCVCVSFIRYIRLSEWINFYKCFFKVHHPPGWPWFLNVSFFTILSRSHTHTHTYPVRIPYLRAAVIGRSTRWLELILPVRRFNWLLTG